MRVHKERKRTKMAVVNNPNPPHGYLDGDGNVDWDAYADEAANRLPLTQGEWNLDEQGRTMSGAFVCSTCDGGGCRDCIG
jgi:hypothetical protein